MAEIGLTEVSATSQAVVANVVQQVLKAETKFLGTVSDYSRFAVKGAASVKVPKRNTFTAADKSENSALSAQELTFSADTISLNKHKAILASLERIAGLQATPDVVSEIIMEQAKELALQLDKDIFAALKSVSTSAPDHLLDYANSPTDTIAQTDILEARRLLNVQNVPMAERFMAVGPDQEKAMLLLSDFVRADAYGSAGGLINGEIGRVYGFTVIMSSLLASTDALFWHRSHVGYATQMEPQFDSAKDLAKVADQYLIHSVYGCGALDSGKRGVYFNGSGS